MNEQNQVGFEEIRIAIAEILTPPILPARSWLVRRG